MKLAVIIPVHNGLKYTINCLNSLSKQVQCTHHFEEIALIVVDDGSTDNTANWINQHHPEVIILKGDGELWWSGAINMGMHYALNQLHTDYILWWNNDIQADNNYLKNLGNILLDTRRAHIIGSKILYAHQPNILWSMGGRFSPKTGKKYLRGCLQPDGPNYQETETAEWLPGMGTLIPVQIISQIGYLDNTAFPQYHGDSDYTFRAWSSGYQILVYPELKIWNDKSQSGKNHNGSWKQLFHSFRAIGSNFNINKDLRFYHKHATSIWAYRALCRKYYMYLGSLIKKKLLSIYK